MPIFSPNTTYYVSTEFRDYDEFHHPVGERFTFIREEFDEPNNVLSLWIRVRGNRLLCFRLHNEKQEYVISNSEVYFSLNPFSIDDFLTAYDKHRFDIRGMYAAMVELKPNENGRNLYHAAAKYADSWAVAYLHDCHIVVQADKNGKTPLHLLADTPLYKHDETPAQTVEAIYQTAKALINAGCDPYAIDNSGQLAYVYAATQGVTPFIRAMAEQQVEMDVIMDNAQNLLHLTCKNLSPYLSAAGVEERCQILQILLNTGKFDVSDEDSYGKTPLDYAQQSGYKAIMALLSENKVAGGMTLHQAVKLDDIESARTLINEGANVNEPDENELSPLMIAISEWQPQDSKQFREPHKYANRKEFDMVELLLKHGADANYKTGSEEKTAAETFLHIAQDKSLPMLTLLIQHGLNVNLPLDKHSNTVLMTVCLNFSPDLQYKFVKLLTEAGADVNLKNRKGFTALHWLTLMTDNITNTARLLIQNGAELDYKNDQGETPLILAAKNTAAGLNLARLLIQHGCNTEAIDNEGKTALAMAVDFGNSAVAKLLIKQ